MNIKKWNACEIKFLKENYPNKGRKYCSEKLNKTENQIKIITKKLKLRVNFKKTSIEITKELEEFCGYIKCNKEFIAFRKCLKCKNKIKHKAQSESLLLRNIKKLEKQKSLCNVCCKIGDKNPFYKKKHTKTTKKKQSKNRIGKACGKNNAMNNPIYRKKVSDALKKKYKSGELYFLKEIQRENAIKNQANGKLKTAPISKAEIEIKIYLENKGFKVKSQFNIGSLKYDLFVKEKNLLIEYQGDYWHCNPEKYDKNYLHKKKNMTAKEIWIKDKHKKQLALDNGFNFITIWEMDYNKDKNKELNKIL